MKNLIKCSFVVLILSSCLIGCGKSAEETKIHENIDKVKEIMSENEESFYTEESSIFEEVTEIDETQVEPTTEDVTEVPIVEETDMSYEENTSEEQIQEQGYIAQSDMEFIIEDYLLSTSDTIADFNSKYTLGGVDILDSDTCTDVIVNYCASELDTTSEGYSFISSVTANYTNKTVIYVLRFYMSYDKIKSVEVLFKN